MDARPGSASRAQRVVAGRYSLLDRLGSGGMGTVWRAHDDVLDREVAVKEVVFPPGLSDAERDQLRERTRREARAAARLHHPNVVTVHDVVEHDGAPFIVMELVEARDLADVVREDGPLAPQRVAEIGLAVLGALTAAHRQGILHRDVKPGNVLLCGTADAPGRVVLTDFGIATSAGDSSITSTGLVLGSPSYIAPERARGRQPGPASDLWSLGATLYTAVEGRPPFDEGEPLATVLAVTTGEPAPFVAAGPLEPVLSGLLARDPEQRLDAGAARAALEDAARRAGRAPTTAPQPASAADGRRADRTTVLPLGDVQRELGPAPQDMHEDAVDEPVPHAAVEAPPRLRPARPAPAPRRAGRTLPLVLAGVVLLAALVGAGVLASRAGDNPTTQAADPAVTQEPPASPAPDPVEDAEPAEQEQTEDPPSEEPQPAAASGPVPPPEGWRSASGGPGWTVFVPPNYRDGSFNGSPEFRDPATGRTVRVSTTGPGGGGDDAVQDRRDQAASFASRYGDYREIAIERIDYRGYEAADWEFTYSSGGTSLHALSRVFVVDGRGYSLFFQTRAGDDWETARAEFERISASFLPT